MKMTNLSESDVFCSIVKQIESYQDNSMKTMKNNVEYLLSIYESVIQLSDEGILTPYEREYLVLNIYNQLVKISAFLRYLNGNFNR